MRRLVVIFAFSVLGSTLFPGHAEATFWKWIDDLSGPRFGGFDFEYRLKCFTEDGKEVARGFGGGGVVVSACKWAKDERRRGALFVDFSYAQDKKPLAERLQAGVDPNNRMVTLGAGTMWSITDGLETGFSAGVAWFSSDTRNSFARAYVEPVRVDVYPASVGRPILNHYVAKQQSREAKEKLLDQWWVFLLDVPAFRSGVVLFPQGFRAGEFGEPTPTRAKAIKYWSVVVDLEPIARKIAGTY